MKIVTTTKKPKDVETEKAKEEPIGASRAIPISTIIPITRPNPEIALIEFSLRPPLTDTTLEFPVSNPKTESIGSSFGLVIDITLPKQPESPPVAPKSNRGKGKVIDETKEPTKKLVPASRKVCPNPDALIFVPYEINGKLFQLTEEQIQSHLEKEEMIKKAAEEAKLLEMTKSELIKVIHAKRFKDGIDPMFIESSKGGKEFKKIQDAKMEVLSREHAQKAKKAKELKQKRIDNYIWTITRRLMPKPITDVKIHPNTKPAILTVYRGNDRRNFDNKIVGEVRISLSNRYARLNKIPEELRIQSALPAPRPEQALECNIRLHKGVLFVNNMVIEEPEYEMLFIDVFGNEAFQRVSDINKVGVETLLTYLVMASNITTPENTRFCLKIRKLIADHPNQEKLKSNKVKLESVGYKLD
ncbi:hypothetical protein Tco_0347962 [Tanacetum coccineum]